ncbi:putative F-box domain-containing protein [Seiridium cardinale]|uniref:F-box domain-containing protein n=1 Tax=Seiridium cardinale TaxID=138064 RepID=A0ABR2XKE4_9PEZI
MTMAAHNHFEQLPPELLLPILTSLPTLESLDNLLRASPAAFRLFNAHGAEIFEAVLSSGAIHEHTCGLIRVAALVRSSSLPPQAHNLLTFRHFVRYESTSHRYDPPAWTLPPLRLSSDVSPSTLRGLLATHRKVACLVISCLRFYLIRFKPLRPSHLVDESFHFESGYHGSDGLYIAAWQQKPGEKPFPVHDIGPPTWVEEQRVLRAFWRLQLFRDLKVAGTKALLVNWPDTDLQRLNFMTAPNFHDVPTRNLIEEDREPSIRTRGTVLEHQLINSVIEYEDEDKQTIVSPDFLQTRREWPAPVEGEKDWDAVSYYSSTTYDFFYMVREGEHEHISDGLCSPLQHVSFRPFRRLGFAIWCTQRMLGYGLLEGEWGPIMDPSDLFPRESVYLAWRSILGEDEIAQVERRNQEAFAWANKPESEDEDSDRSRFSSPSLSERSF